MKPKDQEPPIYTNDGYLLFKKTKTVIHIVINKIKISK